MDKHHQVDIGNHEELILHDREAKTQKKKIKKENRTIFDFGKQRNNTDVTEKQNKMLQQQIKDF